MAPFPYVERGMLVLALSASQACKEGASVSVPPPVDATFASVGAGLLHTCGRTVTNHVYCWGWNHDGEVGDGSTADRIYPVRASVALEFSAVTVGGGHSCGITSGGMPYCWGLNLTGQIGDGSTTSRSTPTPVVGALTFAGVANGGTFTCARASADSTARCWGWARDGELGSRPSETCSTTEGPEPCSRVPIAVGGGHEFIALAAGTRHVCGLATDSTAYCWGRNDAGQLGNGTTADTALPVAVSGSIKFSLVTLGFSHSCGLTATGEAYCWGDNTWGQLGDTTRSVSPTPVRVAGGVIYVALSAGAEHTCGIGTGNGAWCWGQDANSELGAETSETCPSSSATLPCSRRPLAVTTNQSFASISGGGHHTCAVTTGGKAYCWGNNSNGQLGTGNTSGAGVPVRVANQP